ncbi:NUDIX domain-containing protein [Candidatus Pacearchaeota archaeon]|nr:NUDIX domain-containing protein [Candidatus Pacearchaeota archaeon]
MKSKTLNKAKYFTILLGVIFDTKTRKILIGKRKKDPYIPKLTWAFPGGRLDAKGDLEKTLVKKIKQKTGYNVKSLGSIFAKTYPEKKDFLSIYYLCEATSGKQKVGKDFTELKWVKPQEMQKHFTTSFHPKLKEYIMNLK